MRKEQDCTIFIEEPEMHLHPKWQRFFIDTIVQYFPKHQFFFTSHSNIFLGDKRVNTYRVWQDAQDKKTAIEHNNQYQTEILDELGYKSSDLLNANYVLWVEGISDKIYLKQFIKAYNTELVEGVHYSIMFYGGCDNLVNHTSTDNDDNKINILSINPNCGFVMDSDFKNIKETLEINKKEKYKFKQACKKNNRQLFCWITKVREIENLVPVEIWKEASISYAKKFNNNAHKSIQSIDVEMPNDAKFDDRTNKNTIVHIELV